ncbi:MULTISPECIES: Wadjet anti-phage system protein JetD domain-containing protein [unclassified Bradyrhizobium]|uniref:Wadjet anti-phage system protein JetD domain-containing protein n=1 Tax=unclassified Bradyrhizobium TaxID=2631580 RepID=UPI003390AC5A
MEWRKSASHRTGAAPADVPFLHWGDVDAGGVRIFRFLEENLPRGPRPHLMTKALAEKSGQPADADPSLASLARSESAVRELAEWLAFGPEVCHLEQEALEPCSLLQEETYSP